MQPGKISPKLSTMLFAHASDISQRLDENSDRFIDIPLSRQYNVLNRWKWDASNSEGQFGFRGLYETRDGGQMDFSRSTDYLTTNKYGIGIETRLAEFFAKTGFFFKDKPAKSIGTMLNARYHDQSSFFGLRRYNGIQKNVYANVIHQGIIGDTRHVLKTGASFVYDDYEESFMDSSFARTEVVPGAFVEYTYNDMSKFSAVAGFRTDYHNLHGLILTPRLHLRYSPSENFTLRASGGRGFRTANAFIENAAVFATSRDIIVKSELMPEEAWNYGTSVTWKFKFGGRDASWNADFFRTDFINQVIIDREDPRTLKFYNLDGKSYSNSFQTDLNFFLAEGLEARLSYKWYEVKTTYEGKLKDKPFVAKDRMLFNIGYTTPLERWKFDFTTQWYGTSRIPSTSGNPAAETLPLKANPYTVFNGQITRIFKYFDLYLGVENLTNFMIHQPVLGASDPFGPYFDASMIWGPVDGRNIYAGLRFTIKEKEAEEIETNE